MAQSFWTQKLALARILLVSALVLTALSTPLLTQARNKENSSIQVENVQSTVAGLSNSIQISGARKNSELEIALKNPLGQVESFSAQSDASGQAKFTVEAQSLELAGEYEISAKNSKRQELFSLPTKFMVYPGVLSTSASTIKVNTSTVKTGQEAQVEVKLQDDYGNPIEGHVVELLPNRRFASITADSFATDENGTMHFTLSSEKSGELSISAVDSSINKTLDASAELAFVDSSSDRGGNDRVYLSSEGVDGFTLTGLDDPSTLGDEQSVTVTAVDANGDTVTDYTGEIRFSSSDQKATLPSDYTFKASDLGEHTFNLSVKFLTPGDQELMVTDLDNFTLQGSESIKVVQTDASVDLGNNFETTDFVRDGDFTLVSPASGSYSTSSIVIQGEADYGLDAIVYLDSKEVGRTEIDFDNSFSFTVKDLKDGDHELYVDIVELGDGDPGKEEILNIVETSDTEQITIDTSAPKLVSIDSDPSKNLQGGDYVTVTVLSETGMKDSTLVFEDESYPLEETGTKGEYQADVLLPESKGDYPVDVTLVDELGNEKQYRDALSLSVESDGVAKADTNSTEKSAAPKGVFATGGPEKVSLSWETPTGGGSIDHYRIFYGPSPDALFAKADTQDSSTSWTIPELKDPVTYYFSVAAVDDQGVEGEHSVVVSAIPSVGMKTLDIYRPDGVSSPVMANSTLPPQNADSGPALYLIVLLSLAGAGSRALLNSRGSL